MSVINKNNFLLINMLMLCFIFSGNIYAALPKDVQADKYKLQIATALKKEEYKNALRYIGKLEALKVKIPDSILFYKGESLYKTYSYDSSKQTLESYVTKTGSRGQYYKKALVLLSKLDEDPEQWLIDARGSALHAVAYQSPKLFKVKSYLDDKLYPVDIEDKRGLTPLFLAVNNSNYDIVKELIKRGANINHKDKQGNTALHGAGLPIPKDNEHQIHYETIKLLVEAGSDVNAINSRGYPVIGAAITNCNLQTIKLLIKYGADLNVETNDKTLLDWAIKNKDRRIKNNENASLYNPIISLLKKHGVKTKAELK